MENYIQLNILDNAFCKLKEALICLIFLAENIFPLSFYKKLKVCASADSQMHTFVTIPSKVNFEIDNKWPSLK